MPTLILLRHAKSEYPLGVSDHDRPLSDRGRRNAQTIAEHLRPFLAEARSFGVAVSTALRAQQTWEIAAVDTPAPVRMWSDRQLYLAEPQALIEVSRGFNTDVGILVGHNPGIEDLTELSRPANPVVSTEPFAKFATSTFAVLDVVDGGWEDYRELSCRAVITCR